jgi:hypothetical protein
MAVKRVTAVCLLVSLASASVARAETPDARLDAALASAAASERDRGRALGWTGLGVIGATAGAGAFEASRSHDVVWLLPSALVAAPFAFRSMSGVLGRTPFDDLALYRKGHTYDETLAAWRRLAQDERSERRGLGSLYVVLGGLELGLGATFAETADATPIARNRDATVGAALAITGVAMIVDGLFAFVVEGPLARRLRGF